MIRCARVSALLSRASQHRAAHPRPVLGQRCKSFASVLKAVDSSGENGAVERDTTASRGHAAAKHNKQAKRPVSLGNTAPGCYLSVALQGWERIRQKVEEELMAMPEKKVLVIRSSSHPKPLVSREAPVLHHARAAAVVDMTGKPVHHHTTTTTPGKELHLTVDQLLRDCRNSIHIAGRTQQYKISNDDEEEGDSLGGETEAAMVGALPAGALDWRPQRIQVEKLPLHYADLSKSRLTGLVVITAVAGYAMAPAPLDPITLFLTAVGTGLTSCSANAINQFLEVPFDSQMDRTKNRLLVRGLLSPLHAMSFAMVCGAVGIGTLYCGANGLAATLGAANLLLYTTVYTPMKRLTILNTWMGSVVGAIPPLIGWAGCAGDLGIGAWVMAAILYAWQFPHFNSLSWNLRPDYSRAGYRMMAVTDPDLCLRVTLRYSVGMVGICTLAPVLDVTTWTFAADSLPFNAYLVYLAWRFYQDADSKSSRKVFLFSLIHLPVIMMLMIISKKHYGRKKSNKVTPIHDPTRSAEIPSIGSPGT